VIAEPPGEGRTADGAYARSADESESKTKLEALQITARARIQ
jgi:hypothetical protein